MTGKALSMRETADLAGVAYDTFRKSWRADVRRKGFPMPFRAERPFAWDPADVIAWRDRRKAGALPTAANDRAASVHPADRPAVSRAVAQQRADMIRRMTQGAHS